MATIKVEGLKIKLGERVCPKNWKDLYLDYNPKRYPTYVQAIGWVLNMEEEAYVPGDVDDLQVLLSQQNPKDLDEAVFITQVYYVDLIKDLEEI